MQTRKRIKVRKNVISPNLKGKQHGKYLANTLVSEMDLHAFFNVFQSVIETLTLCNFDKSL